MENELLAIRNLFRYINDFFLSPLSNNQLTEIKEILYEIKNTAESIKYRKFLEIKEKIIQFSEKANNINEGISQEEITKLFFEREGNINELSTEIDNIIDPIIKERFKNLKSGTSRNS